MTEPNLNHPSLSNSMSSSHSVQSGQLLKIANNILHMLDYSSDLDSEDDLFSDEFYISVISAIVSDDVFDIPIGENPKDKIKSLKKLINLLSKMIDADLSHINTEKIIMKKDKKHTKYLLELLEQIIQTLINEGQEDDSESTKKSQNNNSEPNKKVDLSEESSSKKHNIENLESMNIVNKDNDTDLQNILKNSSNKKIEEPEESISNNSKNSKKEKEKEKEISDSDSNYYDIQNEEEFEEEQRSCYSVPNGNKKFNIEDESSESNKSKSKKSNKKSSQKKSLKKEEEKISLTNSNISLHSHKEKSIKDISKEIEKENKLEISNHSKNTENKMYDSNDFKYTVLKEFRELYENELDDIANKKCHKSPEQIVKRLNLMKNHLLFIERRILLFNNNNVIKQKYNKYKSEINVLLLYYQNELIKKAYFKQRAMVNILQNPKVMKKICEINMQPREIKPNEYQAQLQFCNDIYSKYLQFENEKYDEEVSFQNEINTLKNEDQISNIYLIEKYYKDKIGIPNELLKREKRENFYKRENYKQFLELTKNKGLFRRQLDLFFEKMDEEEEKENDEINEENGENKEEEKKEIKIEQKEEEKKFK